MAIKKFQEGGFIDEDELFSDDVVSQKEGDPAKSKLDGDLVDGIIEGAEGDPPDNPKTPDVVLDKPAAADVKPPLPVDDAIIPDVIKTATDIKPGESDTPDIVSNLDGVELFLSDYGVKGGIIDFEDGTSSHFKDLPSEEQGNILKSLVSKSVPTIEEKYNLDTDEIDLINSFRESGLGDISEYLNNIVDGRVTSYLQQKNASTLDFDAIKEDDLYILHLKDKKPDFTDEQIAEDLNKAKELVTYSDTVDTIRDSYKGKQKVAEDNKKKTEDQQFMYEVEAQREEVVSAVEDMTDVAGAQLTDEIKEYLLKDIVELNDNNDPILMEKIFSDPSNMFKANWFLTYGEDHINNLNTYWKKQVSAAYKQGYDKSINGMPDNPTIIGADTRQKGKTEEDIPGNTKFGETVTEEELFGN